ncbi:DUF3455 domain-containing protein [Dactylosporangium sucinum]|uniref:DUF3455 domain-containing protein n=1 Tax=Dactylosporangium sucinum TaxID=1424081 RepID=A0A917U067_9ACTN|nr:DUF3455 domain-containing protein [Dactylosporangium sucinum]GGM45439.1 hypothetical protein GCM10007977_053780 [Dactylosporangium sucinum]
MKTTALVAAAVLFPATATASAGPAHADPAVQPPAGAVRVAAYRVTTGFQIYRCAAGAWTLKGPAAMLRDGRRTAYHSAGPSWQSMTDGSSVTAAKKAESPVPGAIPQLLLEVTGHGGTAGGELAAVRYIQRLHTRGGLAPTGACTDGAEQPVPYDADYVFWA